AVGHEQAEHVALAEPAGRERRRSSRDAPGELPVRQRPAARPVDQGGLVAESGRPLQHQVMQGDVGHRDVGIRTPEDHGEPLRGLYYRTFHLGGTPVRFRTTALPAAIAAGPLSAQAPRFEITVSPALRSTAVTGRVYGFVSRRNDEEPRLQVHHGGGGTSFLGSDAVALPPRRVGRRAGPATRP